MAGMLDSVFLLPKNLHFYPYSNFRAVRFLNNKALRRIILKLFYNVNV